MSQTGRVIFTSKYSHMLSVAVNTLKYILDLRGWEGIAIPIVHAVSHTLSWSRVAHSSSETPPSLSKIRVRILLASRANSSPSSLFHPRLCLLTWTQGKFVETSRR